MVHDRPTARELVEAVREFLERDVLPTAAGRLRFHTRVAVNALAIAGREMDLGAAHGAAHEARLAQLGFPDDAALAAAIRDGRLDDRHAELKQALLATVRAKLEVANPSYLDM
jgi:Domain of unknown function (DUF6285)